MEYLSAHSVLGSVLHMHSEAPFTVAVSRRQRPFAPTPLGPLTQLTAGCSTCSLVHPLDTQGDPSQLSPRQEEL